MNIIRTLTFKLLRTYATKPPLETAGIRGKIKFAELEESKFDSEEFELDDMDTFDSDFMHVGESYTMHKRELENSKEKLKRRIVASKYFKNIYPKFLTYVEQDLIRKLHETNPEEWTPEKLSESFPALPTSIYKILRTKWMPQSVEKIVKYDTKVIENWKNFKTGKLVVDPLLNNHLMKFKNRKVSLTNRELLEKLIPPKIQFPKPRSTMFSSILKDCTDKEQSVSSERQISSKENTDKDKKELMIKIETKQKKYEKQEKLTFNEFIKKKLNDLDTMSPEEGVTLLQTYRQQIASANSQNMTSDILDDPKKQINVEKKNSSVVKDTCNESAITEINRDEFHSKVVTEPDAKSNNLDTYIKKWSTNAETEFEYSKPIKIPKHVYKENMTYRVKDCYYDYDGEFLYRIPGLRS